MPSTRPITTAATVALLALAGVGAASPASAGISVPLPPPSAPALVGLSGTATPSTCRGVAADVVVDPGDDFVGTDADEVIVVLGSNAYVRAQGGRDTICV